MGFKRAGCDGVLTYFAPAVAAADERLIQPSYAGKSRQKRGRIIGRFRALNP